MFLSLKCVTEQLVDFVKQGLLVYESLGGAFIIRNTITSLLMQPGANCFSTKCARMIERCAGKEPRIQMTSGRFGGRERTRPSLGFGGSRAEKEASSSTKE